MARFVQITLLCLALIGGSMTCAPKTVGPTAPSGYVFSMEIVPTIIYRGGSNLPQSAELIVRVQDAQGNPVDGVPVEFLLAPEWEQDAALSSSRVLTKTGTARARLRSSIIGIVPITARVEDTTQQGRLSVRLPGGQSGGG